MALRRRKDTYLHVTKVDEGERPIMNWTHLNVQILAVTDSLNETHWPL